MAAKKSKLLNLNWKDIVKSLVVFFVTTIIAGFYQLSQAGELFVWTQVKVVLMTSLTATIAYLIKNFLTNSEDKILKAER